MTNNTPIYARRGDDTNIYALRGDDTNIDALHGDDTNIDALRGDDTTIDALRGDDDKIYTSHRRKRARDEGGPYSSKRRKGPAVGAYKDSSDVDSKNKRKRCEDSDIDTSILAGNKKPKLAEPSGRRHSERLAMQAYNTIATTIVKRRASEVTVPRNSRAARKLPEAEQWIGAEQEELDGLDTAGCMIVVDLPKGVIPIDSKFVYTLKTTSDNYIARYKARLTGRGDQMIEGLEFLESYSPVVSWTGIRLFLALTVLLKLTPLQLDCDLAYINAELDEIVYMNPPVGRELPPGKVWKLCKSLYGLKQSGRNWHKLLDSVLQGSNFNFHSLEEDVCLYVRTQNGVITILFIYVDDIYIASSNPNILDDFVKFLGERFKLKVLGTPSQLLGVTIQWGENYSSVHLSIPKLIDSLIADFDKDNMSITSTPMKSNLKLYKDDKPKQEEITPDIIKMQKRYRTLVGTFIFIQTTCRTDISHGTMMLCRSMANPGYKHMEAALHLLAYLKGTRNRGIEYNSEGNLVPFIYSDADDGSDESRKTTIGNISIVAGGPISWKSTRTNEYSFSTCESEIRAVNAATESVKLAVHLKKIYQELIEKGIIIISNVELMRIYIAHPIEIMEDNKAAILWSESKTGTAKLKHLERNLYWIRDRVRDKTVKLVYVKTVDQLADALTKALPPGQFESIMQRLMKYHITNYIDTQVNYIRYG